MNTLPRVGVLLTAFVLSGVPFSSAQAPDVAKTFVEVQTRGLVHEAFAQPFDTAVQIDPPVPQKPPQPIPEDPPDLRPEGAGVRWIPGYWAWDADNNEFMWISGVYRDAPGGRVYVAGYWEQTADGGWRWVHGYWAPADQREMPYLPPPPASLETGPTLPPPGDDYTYVPGCWSYGDARYVWRPGYYMQCRPGMVWNPACYVWTPRGCRYVSGYWDHPLERRGLLFAPVVFRRSPWQNPGWAWRASHVIGATALLDSLFVDARRGHYRYGDWYGKSYLDRGIQPWHVAGTKGFDPLYAYYRSANRTNSGWHKSLVSQYDSRVTGKTMLPPRSLGQQALAVNQTNNTKMQVVQPLAQIASNSNLKLTKVTPTPLNQTKVAALKTPAIVNTPKVDAHAANIGKAPVMEVKHAPLAVNKTVQSLPKVDHTIKAAATKTVTPQPHVVHTPPAHAAATKTVTPQPHVVHTPPAHAAPPPTVHASHTHSPPAAHSSGSKGKK